MTDHISPMVLIDQYYPPRSWHPLCIRLSEATENNYELKPQYITMLPKFSGLQFEDAYMFINEFEEVCAMMKIKQLSDDGVKLSFIPSSLRDNTKKLLYSLRTNSITTWAKFVAVFLEKKNSPCTRLQESGLKLISSGKRTKNPFRDT